MRVSRGGAASSEADKADASKEPVEQVVFLIRNGKAVMTPVKTGISDRNNMEILSGIQAGDELVSGPYRVVSKTLKDGAPVVIKDAKSLDKAALKEDKEESN